MEPQSGGRRHFLKTVTTAGGALLAGSSPGWAAANDRIRVAIIGMGGRGMDLVRSAAATEGVETATICDPDETRMAKASAEVQSRTGRTPKSEPDLRRIMDDRTIDAVIITSCNHWHALTTVWACQAGKHVYVEKPIAHNVVEGRRRVEAARKYGRIVQAGTQRRSSGRYRKAIQVLREGAIGDLYMAHWVFAGPRETIGFAKPEPPPSSLHWDLWLGPARQQPYHKNLVHYNWHWFWDFGNGDIGNNGAHFMDIACWGMNKGYPSRVVCTGGRYGYKDQGEVPNTYYAAMEYADGTQLTCEVQGLYTNQETRVEFFGSKGYMRLDTRGACQLFMGRSKKPEADIGKLEDEDHFRNFIGALRAGKREMLNCEIEQAEAPTAHCHLANISWRLKRELRFDPKSRKFVGDAEADRMLGREYRAPYVLPERV